MTSEILKVLLITIVASLSLHLLQKDLRTKAGWKITAGLIVLKFLVCTVLAYFQIVSNSFLTWRYPLLLGGLYIAFLADLIRDVIFLLFVLFRRKQFCWIIPYSSVSSVLHRS